MSCSQQPAETVRSLAESRKLLEEARQDMQENRERSQTRPLHTFSPLPGFFPRPAELRAVESCLEGIPSFTVLFGASSVGKTALLREVLSKEKYHVLHFDLRIAGFADLGSLYFSLAAQMEQYWKTLSEEVPGYDEWEKEAWLFKVDSLSLPGTLTLLLDSMIVWMWSDV
jgi:DNA replication protein DnaC